MRKLAVNARIAWATKPKQPGTTLRERIVEEPVPSPLEDFADFWVVNITKKLQRSTT